MKSLFNLAGEQGYTGGLGTGMYGEGYETYEDYQQDLLKFFLYLLFLV